MSCHILFQVKKNLNCGLQFLKVVHFMIKDYHDSWPFNSMKNTISIIMPDFLNMSVHRHHIQSYVSIQLSIFNITSQKLKINFNKCTLVLSFVLRQNVLNGQLRFLPAGNQEIWFQDQTLNVFVCIVCRGMLHLSYAYFHICLRKEILIKLKKVKVWLKTMTRA